jgi:hypothetical protein
MSDLLQGTLATRQAAIRVLIADDHPIVRAGLVAVLTREKDIQVVGQASDGERPIALTRERQPGVVLMDLRMPVLDGVAAIEVITRELPDTRFAVDPQLGSYGGHFGLLGMRERASEVGGRLNLESAPGHGTSVRLQVPIPSRRTAAQEALPDLPARTETLREHGH